MIELQNDRLTFAFPEVHPQARVEVEFQRTLRIPDDDRTYPLPPGLGTFPLRLVDDYTHRLPDIWQRHGGVMLPMYQSEALWINFVPHWLDDRDSAYPFAFKVAAGGIDAITGKPMRQFPSADPQDYLVVPQQPWLDGFCVAKGTIRQFVAMPLGSGYSAEEQITAAATTGGLQLIAYPMKADVFERRFPKRETPIAPQVLCADDTLALRMDAGPDMGLAPGGRMKQQIYEDRFDIEDWDTEHSGRCFVHIANSMVWRALTGEEPPTVPPTAEEYARAGLPWFDYYSEEPVVEGSAALAGLKSVSEMGKEKGDVPLPENASVQATPVVQLGGKQSRRVREGSE